jgi:hypothetical protein
MKIIVTLNSFAESFRACGRERHFSASALSALFEYFEKVEEYTDTEIELDPIAICCDWEEYTSAIVAANDNGFRGTKKDTEEDALEYLYDKTEVVKFDGGLIISSNY